MKKGFSPSSGWVCEAPTLPEPSVQKAFKVRNFIISKGGEIDFLSLLKHPSPLQKLSEQEALRWLADFTAETEPNQLEKPSFVLEECSEGGGFVVRVRMRVKLCSNYEKYGSCKHGTSCLQWHVCRGFLEGNCTSSADCSRSHNLLDEDNIEKSKTYNVEKHSSESIRKVLAKNLPLVCVNYINNKRCENYDCSCLHLCPLLVRGRCPNNVCSYGYSHDLNSPKNKEIFRNFSVPSQYFLAHILLPPKISIQETQTNTADNGSEIRGKRNKKVSNLNNLNTDNDPPVAPQNVSLNIREPTSTRNSNTEPRKQGKSPKDPEKSKLKKQPEVRPVNMQGNYPQPLMSFQLEDVTPSCFDAKEQQHQDTRQRTLKDRQRKLNDFSTQGARPKTLQQNLGNGENSDNEDYKGEEGCAKKKRPRNRGGKKGEAEEKLKSLSLESLTLQDMAPSDQNNKPKKRCNRRRKLKCQDSLSSNPDLANVDKDIQEENEVDLIEFGDEDLQPVEDKLIDLDFDSDQGLSQMSDEQAQKMWDRFSQDQLYEDFGLSQPVSIMDTLPIGEMDPSPFSDPQTHKIKNAPEKGIFNCVVEKFGGIANFSEISKETDLWDPSFQDQEKWFREHTSSFLLVEDSSGNIEQVKAVSMRAKLCIQYNTRGCNKENCPFFHICQEYIAKGRCSNFGGSCNKHHGFKGDHNARVVSKLFPGTNFTNKQLKQVIQSSIPQICLDYNNHRCHKGPKCTKIHLCKNFGRKRCPKPKCKLAHEGAFKTRETRAVLARFKIHLSPKINLFMLAKHQLLICEGESVPPLQPASVSSGVDMPPKEKAKLDDDGSKNVCEIKSHNLMNHICMAFLLGLCPKGHKCTDHHCSLPYQWVYNTNTDKNWKALDDKENSELERLFCQNIDDDPVMISLKLDLAATQWSHQHNIPYIYSVDLCKLKIGLLENESTHFLLRRLSTQSSVLIPECPLTTTWNWYWKDENDVYVEYQPSKGCKDPTSLTIERFYQEGMSKYPFSLGNHDYQLYFNTMYQKNMDPQYFTKRKVKRRPQFLSPEEVAKLKRTCQLPTADNRVIPRHWKTMTNAQKFLLKTLSKSAREFKTIQSLFLNSMGDRKTIIESINRVQNPFMWEKYERKKSEMVKMDDSAPVDERSLFHGTSYRNIRSICRENFDWRLYGEITGNIYGEGAYFARDASFSHCYCHDDEDGVRYVFVAKVLVGSFTKGEKSYRRPPRKDPSDQHSDFFDSCVDDVDSPRVFVVFDVDQYYPEYVIEYTCQPSESSSGLTDDSASNVPQYFPRQSTIGNQRRSTYPSSTIQPIPPKPTPSVAPHSSSHPTFINRSVSAPDAGPTAHDYMFNPSPQTLEDTEHRNDNHAFYYTSQPTIHPYESTSTLSRPTALGTGIANQLEEIERFAKANKKVVGGSKQNCVVM